MWNQQENRIGFENLIEADGQCPQLTRERFLKVGLDGFLRQIDHGVSAEITAGFIKGDVTIVAEAENTGSGRTRMRFKFLTGDIDWQTYGGQFISKK